MFQFRERWLWESKAGNAGCSPITENLESQLKRLVAYWNFLSMKNDTITVNLRDINFGRACENGESSQSWKGTKFSGVRDNESDFFFYHEPAYFSLHLLWLWLYLCLLEGQRIHALTFFYGLIFSFKKKKVCLNICIQITKYQNYQMLIKYSLLETQLINEHVLLGPFKIHNNT